MSSAATSIFDMGNSVFKRASTFIQGTNTDDKDEKVHLDDDDNLQSNEKISLEDKKEEEPVKLDAT